MNIQKYLQGQENRVNQSFNKMVGTIGKLDYNDRAVGRWMGKYKLRRQLEEDFNLPTRLPTYSEQQQINAALAGAIASLKQLGLSQSIPELSNIIIANFGRGMPLAFTTIDHLLISPEVFSNDYTKEIIAHEILRWGYLGDRRLVNACARMSCQPRFRGISRTLEFQIFDISTLPFFTTERDAIAEQAKKMKNLRNDAGVAGGFMYAVWVAPVAAAMGGVFALPAYGVYRAVTSMANAQARRARETLIKSTKRSQLVADVILGHSPTLDYLSYLENSAFPFDTMKGNVPTVRADAVRHPEYQLENLDREQI